MAEYGDYVTGPKIINDDPVKEAMKQALANIQSGKFCPRFHPGSAGSLSDVPDHAPQSGRTANRENRPRIARNDAVAEA